VFDVRPDRSWEERLWERTAEFEGKRITVIGG
jgi:hypothetical protein